MMPPGAFDKCPNCQKHPMAVGVKLIKIGDVLFDEWYCGECGKVVGTTRSPTGPVLSTKHAVDSWNKVVGRVN